MICQFSLRQSQITAFRLITLSITTVVLTVDEKRQTARAKESGRKWFGKRQSPTLHDVSDIYNHLIDKALQKVAGVRKHQRNVDSFQGKRICNNTQSFLWRNLSPCP